MRWEHYFFIEKSVLMEKICTIFNRLGQKLDILA